MQNPAQNPTQDADPNLVETWLRKDRTRWLAGALAGVTAGLAMLVFAGVLAVVGGVEFLFPFKVAAIPFLGNEAMREGVHPLALILGVGILEFLCAFLGVIYAHFTGTNALAPLFGMGLSWGAFSWIFWNNLMFHSFRGYMVLEIPRSAAFYACMVFGISLVSVSFYDRMLRK